MSDTPTQPERDERDAMVAQQKLDIAVRHLYGAGLAMARLTHGQMRDVPRILLAAAAHSVVTMIERLARQQQILERLAPDDPARDAVVLESDRIAGDVSAAIDDFQAAILETQDNMRQIKADADAALAEQERPPAPTVN